MSVVSLTQIAFILASLAAGYLAAYLDVLAWLLHAYARTLRAQWFSPRLHCPRCGQMRHLLRHDPAREGAWSPGDSGLRCLGCSSRYPAPAPERAGSARKAAPERPGMPPSIDGWLQAPQATRARSEARTDNERK